jgi:hypothetical protein
MGANRRALRGRRADGSPVVALWRDGHGRKFFVRLMTVDEEDQRGGHRVVRLAATEVAYAEGA